MAVSDQLREAIVSSGQTHYRIAKETGISVKSLDWFISGQRPELRSRTIDKLCEYLGLELRHVRTPRKQGGKKTGTSRKKGRKK